MSVKEFAPIMPHHMLMAMSMLSARNKTHAKTTDVKVIAQLMIAGMLGSLNLLRNAHHIWLMTR